MLSQTSKMYVTHRVLVVYSINQLLDWHVSTFLLTHNFIPVHLVMYRVVPLHFLCNIYAYTPFGDTVTILLMHYTFGLFLLYHGIHGSFSISICYYVALTLSPSSPTVICHLPVLLIFGTSFNRDYCRYNFQISLWLHCSPNIVRASIQLLSLWTMYACM